MTITTENQVKDS